MRPDPPTLRPAVLLLPLLALMMLLPGCIAIPRGNTTGAETSVAVRTDLEGRVVEHIVVVPTAHHVVLLASPEGHQSDCVRGATLRYYFQGQNGERKELPFLRSDTEPWYLVAAISGSDLWIAYWWTGSNYDRDFQTKRSRYRVVCFDDDAIVRERVLLVTKVTKDVVFQTDDRFHFDAVSNQLICRIADSEWRYDPLRDVIEGTSPTAKVLMKVLTK